MSAKPYKSRRRCCSVSTGSSLEKLSELDTSSASVFAARVPGGSLGSAAADAGAVAVGSSLVAAALDEVDAVSGSVDSASDSDDGGVAAPSRGQSTPHRKTSAHPATRGFTLDPGVRKRASCPSTAHSGPKLSRSGQLMRPGPTLAGPEALGSSRFRGPLAALACSRSIQIAMRLAQQPTQRKTGERARLVDLGDVLGCCKSARYPIIVRAKHVVAVETEGLHVVAFEHASKTQDFRDVDAGAVVFELPAFIGGEGIGQHAGIE